MTYLVTSSTSEQGDRDRGCLSTRRSAAGGATPLRRPPARAPTLVDDGGD